MPHSVIITTAEFYDNVGFFDDGVTPLVSQAVISATEQYRIVDAATVTSVAQPTSDQSSGFVLDAQIVTGTAVITAALDSAAIDQATVTSTVAVSGSENTNKIDAATVTGSAQFTTANVQVVNQLASANDVPGTNFQTPSVAFQNNKLYILSIATRPLGALISSVTGGGMTWDQMGHVSMSSGELTMFRAYVTSGATTGPLTVALSSSNATTFSIDEFTGVTNAGVNGSGAIVQVNSQTASGINSISIALNPFASSTNITYAAFIHGNNTEAFGVDPSGGWAPLASILTPVTNPPTSFLTEYKIGPDLGVQATWTTNSSASAIATEIQSGGVAEIYSAIDAALVTSTATCSGDEGGGNFDSAIVIGQAAHTAITRGDSVDLALVTSAGGIVSTEIMTFGDTATVTSTQAITAQDTYNTQNAYTDQNTVTAVAVPTAADGKTYTDAATLTSTNALSAALDQHGIFDAVAVTSVSAISQSLDLHTYGPDAATVTAVSSSSSIQTFNGILTTTVTGVAVPSALEVPPSTQYVDSATVTSVDSISSAQEYWGYFANDDYNRTTSNGWGTSAIRGNAWTILNGATSQFSTNGGSGFIGPVATTFGMIGQSITRTDVVNGDATAATVVLQQYDFSINALPTGSGFINTQVIMDATDSNNYWELNVSINPPAKMDYFVRKQISGATTTLAGPVEILSGGFPINTLWRFKCVYIPTTAGQVTIQFKVWNLNTSEPSTWISFTDSSGTFPPAGNLWGVRAGKNSSVTNAPTFTYKNYYAVATAAATVIGFPVFP